MGKDRPLTSLPFGRNSQKGLALIPLPSDWGKGKQEEKWWGSAKVCSRPGRNVGLLQEEETENSSSQEITFYELSSVNEKKTFYFLVPFFSCHTLICHGYDFITAENMCLLSLDSWTKPHINPSSPPTCLLTIGLSKHSDFFLQRPTKFVAARRGNWNPCFGPVALNTGLVTSLSGFFLLNWLFLD